MLRGRFVFLAVWAMLAAVATAPAQQGGQGGRKRSAPEPLATMQIRGPINQVSGGGANTFFIVGADEVLVIDAKISTDAARQMLAEIKKVSDKPVRRVVLTHSDGDHVNGLAGMPAGLTLIAHEATRQDMEKANEGA